MKWQRMVIPIGGDHLGKRWHEKNNELIYEVRKEHIRAQRMQRALEGRPPPKPPPMPTPCGTMGKGEKKGQGGSGDRQEEQETEKSGAQGIFCALSEEEVGRRSRWMMTF